MNFKRNLISIIALVASVFTISGCKNKNAFERFTFINEVKDEHKDQSFANGAYVKPGNYVDYIGKDKDGNDENFGSFYETFNKKADKKILKSLGDRKILVVPVEFRDYNCSNLNIKEEVYISNLNKAFFGVNKNNRYVSVAEYYNRSSYGKLRISGKVCNKFYTFSVSQSSLESYLSYTTQTVYDEYPKVVEWYENVYGEGSINEYRLNPNDSNSPVAMYLVYTYPQNIEATNNRDFFWAYTFEDRPLSWSSYSTLSTATGEPDAHTFIHETGHLLGLMDYYPKKSDTTQSYKSYEPTGKIDMMDSSIGDHTAFSKMSLDWARPYYVKKSCEIKINSLINSGDFILINDKWNGTVFDEFYLIELYSPLGLNSFDATNGNSEARLPLLPGIKIYHVDSRLGYFIKEVGQSQSEPVFNHYCNELFTGEDPTKFGNYISYGHNNSTYPASTSEQSYLRNYLYKFEIKDKIVTTSGCASDANLYHKGDTFKVENFNTTNNGTRYNIQVTGVSFYDATLKITKIEG